MEFYTTKEIAEKWNVSSRRVTTLCNEGRVDGAVLKGNVWLIPGDVSKPLEYKRGRKKSTGA